MAPKAALPGEQAPPGTQKKHLLAAPLMVCMREGVLSVHGVCQVVWQWEWWLGGGGVEEETHR